MQTNMDILRSRKTVTCPILIATVLSTVVVSALADFFFKVQASNLMLRVANLFSTRKKDIGYRNEYFNMFIEI